MTEPFCGAVVLSEEEFDAFEKSMLGPFEVSPSITRGAALLDELYGKRCPHCDGQGRTGVFACMPCGATGRLRDAVGQS
jgi:hypothetical protein